MAGINFLHFQTWDELEKYCYKNSFKIVKDTKSLFIAEILNNNGAPMGFVSDRVTDYKPIKEGAKYVLVWE